MQSRRLAAGVAATLVVVYGATLAPNVTIWDAGELISAVETLGIPHPPGTPVYVIAGAVWRMLFGYFSTAVALSLFSAACTVGAAIISARLVVRWTGDVWGAATGAIIAGTMSTAWLSATEAEVYGPSLLLAVVLVAAGERAGRLRSDRAVVLCAYLIALSLPLHLSAIVAAPAAIVLAARSTDPAGAAVWRWSVVALLGGVTIATVGASTLSWPVVAAGVLVAMVALLRRFRSPLPPFTVAGAIFLAALGVSAAMIMFVRAQHDPGLNQGNPSTLSALADVIARRQYTVAPLWPRQAPPWMQIANVVQYMDWQFAVGVAPDPRFSLSRLAATLGFVVLAVTGAARHARRDVRSSRAMLVLLLAGTLGVALQLNLKAGPSIGWGILPEDAPHEPRERDYFFVLGFWAWGLWAGLGVSAVVAERWPRWQRYAPVIALLPIALNWRSVNRRAEPHASIAPVAAHAFLQSAPQRAVLFTGGDNDTYPVWHAQLVDGERPDVVVVAIPLLGAQWYRAEMSRRHALLAAPLIERWRGLDATVGAIASSAERQRRPVAATLGVEANERRAAGSAWRPNGWVVVLDNGHAAARPIPDSLRRRVHDVIAAGGRRSVSMPGEGYLLRLLSCGERAGVQPGTAAADSLDSICNLR